MRVEDVAGDSANIFFFKEERGIIYQVQGSLQDLT